MAQADEFRLPAPGVMVRLSPEFDPPVLKGIKINPDDPFKFEFILDKGDSQLSNDALKDESGKLIKYFLASLTIPEKDLWVNLSPYEKDRIIPNSFGLTEMGRDLLAEDYMLKQITASLIYPEDSIGKRFWKRIYEEAAKKFGTTNIPVNTFNKVWIVPEKAVVYENAKAGTAYVVESRLKVMLEEDYLSLQKHQISTPSSQNDFHSVGANIVREIIIPELKKEINEDKNFSQLRQVYNSLILATWYKKKIKDSILAQVYSDKNKIVGINIDDPKEKEKIYELYLKAFKKGVFNYIKADTVPIPGQSSGEQGIIPRKYFSGGMGFDYAISADLQEIHFLPSTTLNRRGQQKDLVLSVDINESSVPQKPGSRIPDTAMSARYIKQLNDPEHNSIVGKSGEIFTIQARASEPGSNWVKIDLMGPNAANSMDDEFPGAMTVAVHDGEVSASISLDNRYKWFDGTPMGKDLGGGNGIGTALYKALVRVMPEGTRLKEKIENVLTRQMILEGFPSPVINGEDLYYRDQDGNSIKIVDENSNKPDEMTVEQLISRTVMGKLLVRSGLVNLRLVYKGLEGTNALRHFLNDQRKSNANVYFNFEAIKPKQNDGAMIVPMINFDPGVQRSPEVKGFLKAIHGTVIVGKNNKRYQLAFSDIYRRTISDKEKFGKDYVFNYDRDRWEQFNIVEIDANNNVIRADVGYILIRPLEGHDFFVREKERSILKLSVDSINLTNKEDQGQHIYSEFLKLLPGGAIVQESQIVNVKSVKVLVQGIRKQVDPAVQDLVKRYSISLDYLEGLEESGKIKDLNSPLSKGIYKFLFDYQALTREPGNNGLLSLTEIFRGTPFGKASAEAKFVNDRVIVGINGGGLKYDNSRFYELSHQSQKPEDLAMRSKARSSKAANTPEIKGILSGIFSKITGIPPLRDIVIIKNWSKDRFPTKGDIRELQVALSWQGLLGQTGLVARYSPIYQTMTRLSINQAPSEFDRKMKNEFILRFLLQCKGMFHADKFKFDTYLQNQSSIPFFQEMLDDWHQQGIETPGSRVFIDHGTPRLIIDVAKMKIPDSVDYSMNTARQTGVGPTGGIDLTPARMNLLTQNRGDGIKFYMDPAMLAKLQNAPGFVPVIINIRPLIDLKIFLGINDPVRVDKSA